MKDLGMFVAALLAMAFAMLCVSMAAGLTYEPGPFANPNAATVLCVIGCVCFLVALAIDCCSKYRMFDNEED